MQNPQLLLDTHWDEIIKEIREVAKAKIELDNQLERKKANAAKNRYLRYYLESYEDTKQARRAYKPKTRNRNKDKSEY